MSFALTGKESILIYGAGEQGKKFVRLFRDNGFPVKAVLDKRAEELKQITVGEYEVRVFDPERYEIVSQDEVVVISLWNALQHEKIAVSLRKYGFEKIIFVPISVTGNRELASKMRMIFNEILDGQVCLKEVPEYSDIIEDTVSHTNGDTVFLPIELLFSQEDFEISIEELCESDRLKRKNVMKYVGENLMNFIAYYQMYRYLDKAEGECEDYLGMQIDAMAADLTAEREKVFKDRYELFQIYEKAFALDKNFFVDSAPRAIWNPKGYFNINDGHHRVTYLFYKGIRDIPVRVGEEEKEQLKIFENIAISFFCELPALVNAKDSLFWRKRSETICGLLLKKEVFGKRIYIDINDAGYISRYCCRMGCKDCIDIESEEKTDFAIQMRGLFQYQDRIAIHEDMKGRVNVDVAVIDEKYLSSEKDIYASKYILVMEEKGNLHDLIIKKGIQCDRMDKIFNGEQKYLIVRTNGGDKCFL